MRGIFSQIAQISQMLRGGCDIGFGHGSRHARQYHTLNPCAHSPRSYMFKYVVMSKIPPRSHILNILFCLKNAHAIFLLRKFGALKKI